MFCQPSRGQWINSRELGTAVAIALARAVELAVGIWVAAWPFLSCQSVASPEPWLSADGRVAEVRRKMPGKERSTKASWERAMLDALPSYTGVCGIYPPEASWV